MPFTESYMMNFYQWPRLSIQEQTPYHSSVTILSLTQRTLTDIRDTTCMNIALNHTEIIIYRTCRIITRIHSLRIKIRHWSTSTWVTQTWTSIIGGIRCIVNRTVDLQIFRRYISTSLVTWFSRNKITIWTKIRWHYEDYYNIQKKRRSTIIP